MPDVSYQSTDSSNESSWSLDALINQKSRVLKTKLEVWASAIQERWRIEHRNFDRIDEDRAVLKEMIEKIDRQANYLRREHQEKSILYRKLFELETERRKEEVECWRDVVMVLRDLLYVWDAHEQARSKAIFLNDVGV